MPMLRFLARKMWNTRWLTISSLIGLIVAVAFTTSIPMYADGALKRVVAKSLEEKSDGLPAGSLLMRYQATGNNRPDLAAFDDVNTYIREQIPKDIDFPQAAFAGILSIRGGQITPDDPNKAAAGKRRQMTLMTMYGLAEHTELASGAMFSDKAANGVIEAVMLEEALFRNDMHVGDVFTYPLPAGVSGSPLKVKIVGAVKPKSDTDPYWFQGFEGLLNTLMVDVNTFRNELLGTKKIPLNMANWYYAFDLREIKTSQLSPLERKLGKLEQTLYEKLKDTKVDYSFLTMLGEFRQQSLQLQLLLFTLAAPMIAMVFYYIVMNARQSLDRQRSDIAVIRSRGGSTAQIIWMYVLEGFILGVISMIIGPLLGWFMAKSIGSSSGFLTFVDRKAIPVGFSTEALLYGSGAVLLAILASVIPAVMYARASIVGYKQQLARADKKPFWMRFYIDVVLLALSGYGWYMFQERQFLSQQTGLSSDQLQVQPLLFFVPALSIFALGLFFLRIFPWLLRFFGWLGRRFMPVPVYLTLTQLTRSAKSYYPLMLLMIMTLGLGVYNASAARTIDLNSTERVLYQYGTDVIMQPAWEGFTDDLPTNQQPQGGGQGQGGQGGQGGSGSGGGSGGPGSGGGGGGPGSGGGGGGPGSGGGGENVPSRIRYVEPPFQVFEELDGVKAAARVLQTKGNVIVAGRSVGTGIVMGIDNDKFANVAWFRRDLFPAHPFQYLGLMSSYAESVIVPKSFADKYNLQPGNLITLAINQQAVEFVIVGVLPYWPSQYPDQSPFFITNLEYIYDQVPKIPYEVWLKMEDGAKVAPLIEALKAKKVELSAEVKDVRTELARQKKHPSRGGVFGILSLGFLVSVLVSFIGYVLYWFFNLSSRVVQFGVLRAMGLKKRQLTFMLLMEQLFTAGLSIGLGIVIGKLASRLYLPFLQTADDVQSQVPPFRVIFDSKDTLQLYIVVAVMMAAGAGLLFMNIRRLRVHQAVKLGEER